MSDRFGRSVAIDGSTIVVGAYYDDDAGSASGSAYLFLTTDGGATYGQVAKLTAADAAADDRFGYSVATDGQKVVVGAWKDDDAGSSSGSAYVYALPAPPPAPTVAPTAWPLHAETDKMLASDGAASDWFGVSVAAAGDLFAWSVALAGDRLVVGAGCPAWWIMGLCDYANAAIVFRTADNGASWTHLATLTAADAVPAS